MLDRRTVLILAGAAGLVTACGGPPGPGTLALNVQGQPGMNPGPDGSDRPVTLQVLRLRGLGAFNQADFFALQGDPAAALGADLVGASQVAVAPGATAATTVSFEPEAAFVGLVALLRDPGGRVWRTSAPVAPGSSVTANVTLGPGGMALALG